MPSTTRSPAATRPRSPTRRSPAHQWSEPHYELATQRLLGHALATMRTAGALAADPLRASSPTWTPSASTPSPPRWAARPPSGSAPTSTASRPARQGRPRRRPRPPRRPRRRRARASARPELGGAEVLDLAAALEGRRRLLPPRRRPLPGCLQTAGRGAARRPGRPHRRAPGLRAGGLLVIDEFAALAAEQVSRLFARARSAGLSLLLGTQSLADLRAARLERSPPTPSPSRFSPTSSSPSSTGSATPTPPSASPASAGTAPAWSTTERVAGNGTMLGRGERDADPRARVPRSAPTSSSACAPARRS